MPKIANIKRQPKIYVLNNSSFTLGNYGIISGKKNDGKSTFCFQLACDLAYGSSSVMDSTVQLNQNLKTMYLSFEYGESILSVNNGYNLINPQFKLCSSNLKVLAKASEYSPAQSDFLGFLRQQIKKGFRAFVVDNIGYLEYYIIDGKKHYINPDNARQWSAFTKALKAEIEDKAIVIFVQHTTKSGATRGSQRLLDYAQLGWQLEKTTDYENNFDFLTVRNVSKVDIASDFIFSTCAENRYLFKMDSLKDCIFLNGLSPFPLIAAASKGLKAFIAWYLRKYPLKDASGNFLKAESVKDALTRATRAPLLLEDKSYAGKGSFWVGKGLFRICNPQKCVVSKNNLSDVLASHPLFYYFAKVNTMVREFNKDSDSKLIEPLKYLDASFSNNALALTSFKDV